MSRTRGHNHRSDRQSKFWNAGWLRARESDVDHYAAYEAEAAPVQPKVLLDSDHYADVMGVMNHADWRGRWPSVFAQVETATPYMPNKGGDIRSVSVGVHRFRLHNTITDYDWSLLCELEVGALLAWCRRFGTEVVNSHRLKHCVPGEAVNPPETETYRFSTPEPTEDDNGGWGT